ncbi:hypothetical protein BCR42DRAFT_426552 [Absidia repens]|uniref:Galactose oxidase n=1 Tax=Absidia repens TaxID=90262 RepID=A0A1X2I0L0_9FUNG|nr:hypothetical protein BCR42DRAFT_426552 [Absidia repens]
MTHQLITILLLLTCIFFISSTDGYFPQSDLLVTMPFKQGLAADKRGQSIIVFGGESNKEKYTNDLNQLTQTPIGYTWSSLPQKNTPPATSYGRAVISKDGNSMVVLGYNFDTTTWSSQSNPNNVTNTTASPLNRWLHTATSDPNTGRIYIYGGTLNTTFIFADFWLFDPSSMAFTSLTAPDVRRYGHTATLTSNGKLVILGGAIISMDYAQGGLAPMTQLQVFDTTTNQWNMVNTTTATNNVLPTPRAHHTATLVNGTKIIMFGGDNNGPPRQFAAVNSVYVLDTDTWTWSSPAIDGVPASRRGNAVAEMLDDKHLTVTFGASNAHFYNDINALDTQTYSWVRSFTGDDNSYSFGLSTGVIVGVSIACVVLLIIICFLAWRFGRYIRWLITRIHSDIWKPRSGEPLWAETTRMCFQIFLLFIFFIFLAFVVRQAVTSPNVTQTIQTSTAAVDVPDVRFCFDGYPTYPDATDPRNPAVNCQTSVGYSCNQFIQPLDMTVFRPYFADKLGTVSCYLFRTDAYFQLSATSGNNNGSRLIFTLFGDPTITSARIHLSAFPKAMDPNAKIYNINDGTPVLLSFDDVLNWQNAENNDLQTSNVFSVAPFTYSSMGYTLSDHQYLQDVGWNYVGFLPVTNSTPEIETSFRMEAANPNYSQMQPGIGVIAVTPDNYMNNTKREVKMYTLVNALGFVGGIFGLLLALQAWLFGYRPRSPWGVVHRWSVGDMKRSLLRGLQSKFKTTDASGIPLVHPVHKRFSVTDFNNLGNETESQRISRVEERMQVMELLFKAYYVDDEVFRSLDNANKAKLGSLRRRGGPADNATLGDPLLHNTHNDGPPEEKFDLDNSIKGTKPAKSGDYELVDRHDSSSSISSSSSPQHGSTPKSTPL